MTSRHRPRSVSLALAAAACSSLFIASAAVLAQNTPDYTTLPPDPAELEQKLTAAHLSLTQAMAAVVDTTGGKVIEAKAMTVGDHINYEVLVNIDGSIKRAIVDGKTGAVSAPILTPISAVEKAMAVVKGSARSVTFDLNSEPPKANVSIYHEGQAHRIVLNAIDGSLISNDVVPRFPGIQTTNEIEELDAGEDLPKLLYIDIEEGTGAAPAGPNSMVRVHYTGYFTDGTKFDSSVDRGAPANFPLSGVIKGWGLGVGSMKVGGKRKLIVPFQLGYGERGRPPIPPKAMLIFDVELLDADMQPATPAPAPAGVPRDPSTLNQPRPSAPPTPPPSGTGNQPK